MVSMRAYLWVLLSISYWVQASLVIAQTGDDDGDFGTPAEPTPAQPSPAASSNQTPKASKMQSPTLPAPLPEPLVQPYPDAPAQQSPVPPVAAPGKPKPVVSGRLAELNLSPEQAQQIIDIRRQWRPDVEKRLKEEFAGLKALLAQAMADASAGDEVRRRFEAMQKKYFDLQTLKFDKLLKIREVLTPEQRRKFAELRSRNNSGAGSGGD